MRGIGAASLGGQPGTDARIRLAQRNTVAALLWQLLHRSYGNCNRGFHTLRRTGDAGCGGRAGISSDDRRIHRAALACGGRGTICITVAVAASMGANAAYFAVNADVMPRRAATGAGITDFTFALAGFIAPVLSGWVLNLRGSFTDVFLLMAVLAASSVVLVLAYHNPDRDRVRYPD